VLCVCVRGREERKNERECTEREKAFKEACVSEREKLRGTEREGARAREREGERAREREGGGRKRERACVCVYLFLSLSLYLSLSPSLPLSLSICTRVCMCIFSPPHTHTVVPGFPLHWIACLYEQVLSASPASPAQSAKRLTDTPACKYVKDCRA